MEVQAPAERLLLERVEDNRVFVLIVKFVLGVCRHNAARGCDLSSEPPDTLVTIIIIARLPLSPLPDPVRFLGEVFAGNGWKR